MNILTFARGAALVDLLIPCQQNNPLVLVVLLFWTAKPQHLRPDVPFSLNNDLNIYTK